MTRSRMLFLVSMLTVLAGLGWVWSFFEPIFVRGEQDVLNPILIFVGILFLFSGWGLFRRNEFALEFGFWAWFASLVVQSLSTVFLLVGVNNVFSWRNVLALIVMLIVLAVHLFVLIFLEQKGTKQLFIPTQVAGANRPR